MNIVIMVDALHSIAAGSERQIYKLICGLIDAGQPVTLVLLRHTPFTEKLTDFPCQIISLNIPRLASPVALKTLWAFRRQLKVWRTTTLHAWLPESCLIAPLLLKNPSMHVITSRRDMGLIYRGKPAWLYRLANTRVDAVVSNAQAVAQHIQRCEALPSQRSKVIYNGLDDYAVPRQTVPAVFKRPDSLKLILVANIKPVKRTLDAVNAVLQLNAQGLSTELALVGELQDTNYVSAIKNTIAARQGDDHIHWLGSVSEPRQLLPQADIGLLVSDSEGLSNTVMEYMQAGLAVVATQVGGNPELIEHDHNGLLVAKGDTAALAAAITQLGENPSVRQTMGQISQQRIATDFSLHAMVQQHLALYSAPQAALAPASAAAQSSTTLKQEQA